MCACSLQCVCVCAHSLSSSLSASPARDSRNSAHDLKNKHSHAQLPSGSGSSESVYSTPTGPPGLPPVEQAVHIRAPFLLHAPPSLALDDQQTPKRFLLPLHFFRPLHPLHLVGSGRHQVLASAILAHPSPLLLRKANAARRHRHHAGTGTLKCPVPNQYFRRLTKVYATFELQCKPCHASDSGQGTQRPGPLGP